MRCRFIIIGLFSILIAIGIDAKAGMAQFPFYSQIQPPSLNINIRDLENKVVAGSVYLDGKRLFSIAAPRASLNERLQNIQDYLSDIRFFHQLHVCMYVRMYLHISHYMIEKRNCNCIS